MENGSFLDRFENWVLLRLSRKGRLGSNFLIWDTRCPSSSSGKGPERRERCYHQFIDSIESYDYYDSIESIDD